MIERGGSVVIKMLPDVKQQTIKPVITDSVLPGALLLTDEYDIYSRVTEWGYGHKTVCHSKGEYARDEDGDGFCEVHVNTIEGFWSLLRSWLRPHRESPKSGFPSISDSLSSYIMSASEGRPFLDLFSRYC